MGIIDWIVNGWRKLLMYAGIAAVVFASGVYTGYQYRDGQEAKKVVEAIVEEVESKDENQGVADSTGKKVEAKQEEVRQTFKKIDRQVGQYEKTNPDADSPIGAEWVCLFNASARGEPIADGACKLDSGVQGTGADSGRPAKGNKD